MTNTADDGQATASYQNACEEVVRWEHRMGRQESPLTGSDLDADDTALMGQVPSEISRLALVSGTEALQLVRESLNAGLVYVSATNGPIRTALLAASHTVFQLAPDCAEVRRERQRFAQRAYYSNMSSYFRERLKVDPDPYFESLIVTNGKKIDALNEVLGCSPKGKPRRPVTDTDIVSEAAEEFGEQNAAIIRLHWRRLSGDAHALGWQLLLDGVQQERTVGHMFEGKLMSDEANTYRHFTSAASMLKRGWSLFDQRCDVD